MSNQGSSHGDFLLLPAGELMRIEMLFLLYLAFCGFLSIRERNGGFVTSFLNKIDHSPGPSRKASSSANGAPPGTICHCPV